MLGFTKFKINRLVNRRELYSNFSYNKWNQLDTGSKWKCLQQLENHFAAEQGRPAVKVLPISSKEVRGDYGGYDPDKNVIYINRDLVEYGTLVGPVDINHPTQLDANMQLFDTIAHEGYHAYQGYAIKHPGFHKDMKQVKEWAINDRNVKYFRRGDEYLVQPRERDAWKYGSEKTREAFDEIEKYYGTEPGRAIIRNTRSNLTNEDVMIIFDTKGDFYKEFYRPGDVVISNDARATGGSEADYWNIFEEVTIDDRVEENILEIAKGLFAEKLEHTTQPFFPNAAKDLFAALMLHLVRNDKFADKRNNKSLRSYLNSITPHIMVDILNQHSDLKAMQSYIYDEKSGQTLGVMAELQQMMREIFIGNFQKKGGLSMRKLVRRKGGRVIFVEYDLGIGGMLMPIYRLLIDLAIKEALCRTSNEGNVYFFIDEFRLVPHLEHIDDGVNFGRSLGAKFFVGIQNIDQVMAAYGEYTGRSILSGFGTTFAFRVNDVGSREYIKNLFGRNIKQQSYMSKVQNRGIAEQLREGYVVEDDDINNLPVGEAIVSAPSGEPFRFKFNLYQ